MHVDGCLLDSAELVVDESVLEGRWEESATLHKASSSFSSWALCVIDGRENGQSPSGP